MFAIPVHVGELHLVVIEHDELADATAGEHFACDAADAADADDEHREVADALEGEPERVRGVRARFGAALSPRSCQQCPFASAPSDDCQRER